MNKESAIFEDGDEVRALLWESGETIQVGIGGVEKITVVMEYGQMAGVPWFAVWSGNEIISKHNGAYVSNVNL